MGYSLTEMYGSNIDHFNMLLKAQGKDYRFVWEDGEVKCRKIEKKGDHHEKRGKSKTAPNN